MCHDRRAADAELLGKFRNGCAPRPPNDETVDLSGDQARLSLPYLVSTSRDSTAALCADPERPQRSEQAIQGLKAVL